MSCFIKIITTKIKRLKVLILIVFSFIATIDSIGQKNNKPKETFNLLANGGLEDLNKCREFDILCEPEAWFYLPAYIEEPQGNDSNKYEVIAFGNLKSKTRAGNYFYTKMLCPLHEGKQYQFSIWIATPKNEFDHLDVYFTYLEPIHQNSLNIISTPSISITKEHAISNQRRWTKYNTNYTANGAEKFLIIGNFSDNIINNEKSTANNKDGEILYAIDNISFFPLDSREQMCDEYYANMKQLYDQNYRHPAKLNLSPPLDTTLLLSFNDNFSSRAVGTSNKSPVNKTDTLIIPDILFSYNSSKINPEFIPKLQYLITNIRIRHFTSIEVVGHTDNIGNETFNKNLSLQRANAIKKFIIDQMHLPKTTIETQGLGKTMPIATNETNEGRKKNRRVEIILKHH